MQRALAADLLPLERRGTGYGALAIGISVRQRTDGQPQFALNVVIQPVF